MASACCLEMSKANLSYSTTDNEEVINNIDGRMHGPMNVFITKYFGNFRYVRQGAALQILAGERTIGRCAIPSHAPSRKTFLQWFFEYMSAELDGVRGSWHISSSNENADDGARLLLAVPTPLTYEAQAT